MPRVTTAALRAPPRRGHACSPCSAARIQAAGPKRRQREPPVEALLWVVECIQGPRCTTRGVSHTWKTRTELKLTGREEEGCFQPTFSDRNPLHSLSYKPSFIGAFSQQAAHVPVALIHFKVHTERGQDVPLCQPLIGRCSLQSPEQPHRLHARIAAPQRWGAAEVELSAAPSSVASVGLEELPALVHQAGSEGDRLLRQQTRHTDLHRLIEEAPGGRQNRHLHRHPSAPAGEGAALFRGEARAARNGIAWRLPLLRLEISAQSPGGSAATASFGRRARAAGRRSSGRWLGGGTATPSTRAGTSCHLFLACGLTCDYGERLKLKSQRATPIAFSPDCGQVQTRLQNWLGHVCQGTANTDKLESLK